MNATASLPLFNITSEFIKDNEKARAFVLKINQAIDNKFNEEKRHLATKIDLSELKADLLKWHIALFLLFYIGMIVFLVKNFL